MKRKVIINLLLSFVCLMSFVTINAEEYYIKILSDEQSSGVFGFDLKWETNVPELLIEVYFPEDSDRAGELRYTSKYNSRILEIINGQTRIEQSLRTDPEGEYRVVLSYGECIDETIFILEGAEQYWEWYDNLHGYAEKNEGENEKNQSTGNKNTETNRVTAITVDETEIVMYPEDERKLTVTSRKSITVEVEDTDIIDATYLDGILTISALKAGKSEIWLKTNDNYINICVQVMNDTAKGASAWAKEDIRKAIADGFVPEKIKENWTRNITREEFAEIAVLFLELKPIYSNSPFLDTTNPYVTVAYESGIVTGVGDGKFNPKEKITRQEAAVMLLRVAEFSEVEIDAENVNFEDSKDIASWAKNAAAWVKGKDIMHGDEKGNFNPTDEYTCEQAIATFVRLQEQMCN